MISKLQAKNGVIALVSVYILPSGESCSFGCSFWLKLNNKYCYNKNDFYEDVFVGLVWHTDFAFLSCLVPQN